MRNPGFDNLKKANAMTFLSTIQTHISVRAVCFSLMMLFSLSSIIAQTKACPTTQQVKTEDLHGQWSVDFTDPTRGMPTKATLQLQRHAEYSESLAGTLQRDLSGTPGGRVPGHAARAQVAGDLEGGMLLLDESSNGINLTASWDGKVVDGSCGQTIQGVWKDLSSDAPPDAADVPFTMRQTSGW